VNIRAAANACSHQNNLKEVKMFRFGFLFRLLLALLIIGGLVGGGVAIYRLGWAQGYQTAAVLANKTGTQAAPAVPAVPYYGYPYGYPIGPFGYGYGPRFGFPFIFPLVGLGFFLLFLFFIGGLFRFGMHRNWAQGGQGYWHGRGGPWGWGPQGPQGSESKEPGKGQADQGEGTTKES
jgi:hypothetical protein